MKNKTEIFIEKAKKIHGNLYDYGQVNYVGALNEVIIICHKHKAFIQVAHNHLNGHGCPLCAIDERAKNKKSNSIEFIKKANGIHGNMYDYSQVDYVDAKTNVSIVCPTHKQFYTTPNNHLQGRGCPICGGTEKFTKEKFIEKAKIVHNNNYNYSKVEYINMKVKVIIICATHQEFEQRPDSHLSGFGCPRCKKKKKISLIKKITRKIYHSIAGTQSGPPIIIKK